MSTKQIIKNLAEAVRVAKANYDRALLDQDELSAALLEGQYDRAIEAVERFQEATGEVVYL